METGETIEQMVAQATALRTADRNDEAVEVYRAAIRSFPDNAQPAQHLGVLLAQQGRAAEAEPLLRRALAAMPGHHSTRFALAQALKTLGRWTEAAWYGDARFDMPHLQITRPALPFPQWRSFHAAGRKILVFPEQGYGDQIVDMRFIAPLIDQGAHVTLLAYPPLLRLFTDSFANVQVLPSQGDLPVADRDFWIASSDLAAFVGATPDSLPTAPYLRTKRNAPPLPGFTVGLVTRGNPANGNDARRSLSEETAQRLRTALPGRVVSLHPEDSGATDFADTAALIAQLDLVVSVETAVAHLAGAMGKRCLVLVPGFNADWHWGPAGETTAWYPSMRLYRGDASGSWEAAIARIINDANALAA